MSIESRQREITRHSKEVADLQKKDSDEQKKEVSKFKEIEKTTRSLNSTKSDSTARSYGQKLVRLGDDVSKSSSKRADIAKKLAAKNDLLYRSQLALLKEKETETKKVLAAEKKREREQLAHQQKITNELKTQKDLLTTIEGIEKLNNNTAEHDVFISHASEDKESLVRPLAEKLNDLGFKVWYDESSLTVGDSLRQKIDQGLVSSRYGIVVLSESFFAKNWPQYELNGLVAREMHGGKIILPIWHKVSKDEVLGFSPTLADKVALNTAISSISEIAQQLSEVLSNNGS